MMNIREYVAKLPHDYRLRCIKEWNECEVLGSIPTGSSLRRAAEEFESNAPYSQVVTTMRDIIFEIYRLYTYQHLGLDANNG